MAKSILYESFHEATTVQKKIIKRKNFTYQHIFHFLFKYLNKHDEILDIGCGAGAIDIFLGTCGYNIRGIDISQNAIKLAKESAHYLHLKNIKFDVCNFPQQSMHHTYDFIIFSEVLEHLKNEKKALNEIYLLLKNNGKLLITVPSSNAPLYKLGLTKSFDERVGHLRRYTQNDLEKLLENAGFKIIETAKHEGIVRNFLFLNPIAGKFVRFIKYGLIDVIGYLDKISLKLFGESDIIILAQKIIK